VVEQQIHYRSTKKTFERALNKAGISLLTLTNFPQFEEKALSTMNLSIRKLETILRVVQYFEAHPAINWPQLEEQEIRAIFKSIKGIGTWTVEMLLLYSWGKPDIFPADDYHLKNSMAALYGLNKASRLKTQMKEVAAHWAPYRSYAVRYLLAWKEQRGKKLL
jgi:DNA-3-methyladenine glycosylase II